MRTVFKIAPLMLLSACAYFRSAPATVPPSPAPAPVASAPVAMPASAPAPAVAPVAAQPAEDEMPNGVGFVGAGIEPDAPKVVVKQINPFQPITIRVTGNGAPPVAKALSKPQRRLLAMRAARLDAYRAIAEQVQGLKLVGNSTVADMITTSDSFRTYVDAFLRGVNIVSATMEPDGSCDVVATIVLDRDFYLQFKTALQQTGSVMKAAQQNGAQGVECGDDNCGAARYNSNFYNAQ